MSCLELIVDVDLFIDFFLLFFCVKMSLLLLIMISCHNMCLVFVAIELESGIREVVFVSIALTGSIVYIIVFFLYCLDLIQFGTL